MSENAMQDSDKEDTRNQVVAEEEEVVEEIVDEEDDTDSSDEGGNAQLVESLEWRLEEYVISNYNVANTQNSVYRLECMRPGWFKDNLDVAGQVSFSAKNDLHALYKMHKYFLLHGKWANDGAHERKGSPLNLIKYAMDCPQWDYFRILALKGKKRYDSDDDEDEVLKTEAQADTEDDLNKIFDKGLKAILGFYGLGEISGPGDCALKIVKGALI